MEQKAGIIERVARFLRVKPSPDVKTVKASVKSRKKPSKKVNGPRK